MLLAINYLKMDNKKISEDPNTKELNQFVQNMLKQMQERFDEMSSNIIGRVDEMGICMMSYRQKNRRYLEIYRRNNERFGRGGITRNQ